MKNLFLALAMTLTAVSASAAAKQTLNCKYYANETAFYINATIKSEQELNNVTTVTYDLNSKKVLDRKDEGTLTADDTYKPTQYKGYSRFYTEDLALILPPNFSSQASFETRGMTLGGPAHDAPNTSLTVRCLVK